jgi:hypothetical protein
MLLIFLIVKRPLKSKFFLGLDIGTELGLLGF